MQANKDIFSHYRVAQKSLECYLKGTNYPLKVVDLDHDEQIKEKCGRHKQVVIAEKLITGLSTLVLVVLQKALCCGSLFENNRLAASARRRHRYSSIFGYHKIENSDAKKTLNV